MDHYKNGSVCPICGTPDWCGYILRNTGVLIYCHRWSNADKLAQAGTKYVGDIAESTIGFHEAGITVFRFKDAGETQDGFRRFRDLESWQAEREAWLRAHGYSGKGSKMSESPKGLSVPAKSSFTPTMRKDRHLSDPAAPADLDRFYRRFLELLLLESGEKQELIDHDRWGEKLFAQITSRYPIRSLQPDDFLRYDKESPRRYEFGKLRNPSRKAVSEQLAKEFPDIIGHVPGFYRRNDGQYRYTGLDGYLLPQYDREGHLYRLRVRTNAAARNALAEDAVMRLCEKREMAGELVPTAEEQRAMVASQMRQIGKYQNFSSTSRDYGCEGGSQLSFYGLHLLPQYEQGLLNRIVVLEGEKKGIVGSEKLGLLHIALPGVGMYRMLERDNVYEWLKGMGVRRISVANDADMMTNPDVARATAGLLVSIWKNGFIPEMARWSETLGKGLDDMLISGGVPVFQPVKGIERYADQFE